MQRQRSSPQIRSLDADPGFAKRTPSSESIATETKKTVTVVLVIDDDPNIRRLVKRVLASNTKLHFFESMSAEEGERFLLGIRADVMISDMRMGGSMTGLELMKRMREKQPEMRAILMSGDFTPEEKEEARSLGAALVMDKPLDLGLLKQAVDKMHEEFTAQPTDNK
jgi:two-component system response regulator (stage 0 sporulation protein F)